MVLVLDHWALCSLRGRKFLRVRAAKTDCLIRFGAKRFGRRFLGCRASFRNGMLKAFLPAAVDNFSNFRFEELTISKRAF
jgi:hypothetical protein